MNDSTGGENTQRMTIDDVARHTGFIYNDVPFGDYIIGAVNWAHWNGKLVHPLPECGYWDVGSASLDEVLRFFRDVINANAPYNPHANKPRRTRSKRTKRSRRDRRKYVPPKPLTLQEKIQMAKAKAKQAADPKAKLDEKTTKAAETPKEPEVKMVKLVDVAASAGMTGQEARRHLRAAVDNGKLQHDERSRWEWPEGSDELDDARRVLEEAAAQPPKTRGRKSEKAEAKSDDEAEATESDDDEVTDDEAESEAAEDEPTDEELDAEVSDEDEIEDEE